MGVTMEKYTMKVENGVLTLPDEIIKQFDLKPGDKVKFNDLGNGSVEIKFPKKEDVEIELSDEEIFSLMKIAHERDITLNKLIEEILIKEMNKYERKISLKELEDRFDDVLDDVSEGATYIVHEDDEYTKPLAVLVPYQESK